MFPILNSIINNSNFTTPEIKKDLTLFMNITVGQLLFEGQKIKFLTSLRKALGDAIIDQNMKGIKNDTFGLFFGVSFKFNSIFLRLF